MSDPQKNTIPEYLIHHRHKKGQDCCELTKVSDAGTPSAKICIHPYDRHGWSVQDVIEGLVSHLRWKQSTLNPSSLNVEHAIKSLESAWTHLSKDPPPEK